MFAIETRVQMVQRHIRQGAKNVSRQREIIAELTFRGQPTDIAETILINFEQCLEAHEDHLARLPAD